jgi:hypothetical protein
MWIKREVRVMWKRPALTITNKDFEPNKSLYHYFKNDISLCGNYRESEICYIENEGEYIGEIIRFHHEIACKECRKILAYEEIQNVNNKNITI